MSPKRALQGSGIKKFPLGLYDHFAAAFTALQGRGVLIALKARQRALQVVGFVMVAGFYVPLPLLKIGNTASA